MIYIKAKIRLDTIRALYYDILQVSSFAKICIDDAVFVVVIIVDFALANI